MKAENKPTAGQLFVTPHNGHFYLTADRNATDVEGVAVVYKEADATLFAAALEMRTIHEDSVEILEVVLEEREQMQGEEDEILRDLIARIKGAISKSGARAR